MLCAAYVHVKEQQQQAYIHGAIAGAAMGASAVWLFKTNPGMVHGLVKGAEDDVEWAHVGKQATAAFKQRVGNLTTMFATAMSTTAESTKTK